LYQGTSPAVSNHLRDNRALRRCRLPTRNLPRSSPISLSGLS